MDLLVNPTSEECKQSLLTSDVHEGSLPCIIHSVALSWSYVDRQHDVVFHVLKDQVVHYNIHIVHHTSDQALYITCEKQVKRKVVKRHNIEFTPMTT